MLLIEGILFRNINEKEMKFFLENYAVKIFFFFYNLRLKANIYQTSEKALR